MDQERTKILLNQLLHITRDLETEMGAKLTLVTAPQSKPEPQLKPELLKCSVCHEMYQRGKDLSNAFWVSRSQLPRGFKDFSVTKAGKALIRTCSMPCTEKFSNALSMKNAGIAAPAPDNRGVIRH